jgi:hypothetical protein
MISEMIDDGYEESDIIPVLEGTGKQLTLVVEFLDHFDVDPYVDFDLKTTTDFYNTMKPTWYCEYMDRIIGPDFSGIKDFYGVINTANFLGIQKLVRLCQLKLKSLIYESITYEENCKRLDCVVDDSEYTPEKIQELRGKFPELFEIELQ